MLDFGTKIAEGPPDEVLNDPKVLSKSIWGRAVSLLEVADVDTAYGAIVVNRDVSLTRRRAARSSTILGPNGAGKTTLLRAISGLLRPKRGTIRFDGEDVTGVPADRHGQARRRAWCRRGGASSPT